MLPRKVVLLRYFVPVIAYLGFLIFLTLRADNELPALEIPYLDKIAHVFLFTILSFLICRFLLTGLGRETLWKIVTAAFLLAALYGAVDEFVIQPQASGRHMEIADYFCNLIGSALGAGLTPSYRRWKNQKTANA